MTLKAEQLNRQGIELSDKGKLDKAILAFTTALELEPANADVIYNMALVFIKKRDWTAAEELLQRAEQLQPDNSDYLTDQGLCLYEMQHYDSAEDCYRKALELDPMNKRAWNNLGVIYFVNRHYSQAEEYFRTAVTLDPDYSDGWYNLKDTLEELGQLSEAREAKKHWQELTNEG